VRHLDGPGLTYFAGSVVRSGAFSVVIVAWVHEPADRSEPIGSEVRERDAYHRQLWAVRGFQQFSAAKACVLAMALCTSLGQFSVRLESGLASESMTPDER
jgi:hypothetical protein